METTYKGNLELDKAGKFLEFPMSDMVSGRLQARLTTGTPWGGAVIAVDGSVTDEGPMFNEISSGNRISEESLSTVVDLTALRRVRCRVFTASSTSGAIAELAFCAQNPNWR